MICLTNEIPKLTLPNAEIVKINCIYDLYRDVAQFWVQNETQAIISMLDRNMVIYNKDADTDELGEFIKVISPSSVFSDSHTLRALFGDGFTQVNVMKTENSFECDKPSDIADSKSIYEILSVSGLELPPYEFFAVDFCRRLNHGQLKYFAIEKTAAALAISDGQTALINGIASHEKGMGTLALQGLLSQYEGTVIAVCKDEVVPFYQKNKFEFSYNAGYWRGNL